MGMCCGEGGGDVKSMKGSKAQHGHLRGVEAGGGGGGGGGNG